jgi:diguanylate cyclase (GGDEF)-like protein
MSTVRKRPSTQKMSILIVCADKTEGDLLRITMEELIGAGLRKIAVVKGGELAMAYIKESHPDVLILSGISPGHSEAVVLETRLLDGKRHTGVIVVPPKGSIYDSVAAVHLQAGADVILPRGTSFNVIYLNVIALAAQKFEADELRIELYKYQNMNLVDELTGLANMRGFLAKFAASFEKCRSGAFGMALIMLDLDHFKKVNDTTNHMVGSYVIKSVGHLIAQQIGQQIGTASPAGKSLDFAARFGGDEFIIVLHGTEANILLDQAEELRKTVEKKVFAFQGFSINVSCSQGLCWVPPKFDGNATDIVKGADAMLYKSKGRGRNTIVGMNLWYPIDFNHIGGAHVINWNPSGNNNRIPGRNKA